MKKGLILFALLSVMLASCSYSKKENKAIESSDTTVVVTDSTGVVLDSDSVSVVTE